MLEVNFPPEVETMLTAIAKQHNMSLHDYLVMKITEAVEKDNQKATNADDNDELPLA